MKNVKIQEKIQAEYKKNNTLNTTPGRKIFPIRIPGFYFKVKFGPDASIGATYTCMYSKDRPVPSPNITQTWNFMRDSTSIAYL